MIFRIKNIFLILLFSLISCGEFDAQGGILLPFLLNTNSSSSTNSDGDNTDSCSATPGVSLEESSSATTVTEGGSGDSYTLVLDSCPSDDVIITLTPDSQLLVNDSDSAVTITFTSSDWDTQQTVLIEAVDDDLAESSHTGSVTHSVSSTDSDYGNLTVSSLSVTITDNDSSGVSITESGGSTSVNEGGLEDTYTIVLTSEPTSNVTITATPDSQTTVNGSGTAINLTFTSANWDTSQTITVGAAADSVAEGSHTGGVSHSSTSSDDNYSGLSISSLVVSIGDSPFPAWTKRRKITFGNSAQTEALTDFPVLVKLNGANIDYAQTQNNGEDIRFHDSDGVTELSYEIESWDESGDSYVWVKVPEIDGASSSDHIWMYYGNPTATDNQDSAGVWDGNYEAVMHHNGDFLDSTSNGNDGTPSGGPADVTTAQIGGGKEFLITSSQFYSFGTTGWSAAQGTVEAWAYPYTSSASNQYVFSHRVGSTDSRIYLLIRNNDEFWIGIGDCYTTGNCGQTGYDLSLNTWQNLVLSWDGGSFSVYLNGSEIVSSSSYSTPGMSIDASAAIGQYTGGGEYFDGIVDEVRVSSIARSSDWIAAQYLTMTDSFLTFGSEEDL